MAVSFPLLFVPPTIPIFLTASFFQLNCYSIDRSGRPPSVSNGNKVPPLPSTSKGRVEKGLMVSLPLVSIFPFTIPIFFSRQLFLIISYFQFNCCSVGHTGHPPSVNQGNKGPPPPSLPVSCLEKDVMASFPLVLNFSPPFQDFSHRFFLSYSVS